MFLALSVSVVFADVYEDGVSCADDCHIIKPYAEGAKNADLLVSKHMDAGIGCADCHERSEQIENDEREWYKNGEFEEPMFAREYEADFCLKCHESYKVVAERTVHLVDEWGRNPHESHLGESDCGICHKAHRTSEFVCAECHHAEWEKRLPAGWVPKK